MSTAEPIVSAPASAARSERFLPHVQGLRAIAVLAVVLFHFWPGRISGGYVGVDIFFVISGYLITGHLLREIETTGRVRLAGFWARRARRLLPASLLVLLFCALVVGSPYLFPTSQLPAEIREIIASTFYVENWSLAFSSTDYLAHSGEPTTVQHYWSLSLEEQFYVVWPLLMLLAAWIGVRFARGHVRQWTLIVLGAVSLASFAFCVWFTATNPAPAYFVTPARMWEFGVGAALALLPALKLRHPLAQLVLGWGGLIAILYAVFRFDGETPFPGFAALVPVLGTAAVIVAARADRWWFAGRVLAIRPAQFLGNVSYSLYLWHWPLIVIAPSVPFWGLTIYHRVALLVICVVLAWLTKRFVEDPARRWRVLTARRPRVSLWASLVAMIVVAAVALGSWAANAQTYDRGVAAIAQLRENPPECFGAASVTDASCAGTDFGTEILPAPGFASADRPSQEQCFVQLNDTRPVTCEFGSDAEGAPQIALVGDSHAFQLLPTLIRIADERGWHLTTLLKGACPWNETPLTTPGAFGEACQQWRQNALSTIDQRGFDAIVTAGLATTPYSSAGYASSHDAAVAGYRGAWSKALGSGIPIITVVDNPTWENDPNKCLRTQGFGKCDGARSEVLAKHDPIADAAAGTEGVTLLDFTDVFCGADECSPVVGGANIYRDQDHLTVSFVDSLAPQWSAAIQAALDNGVPVG